LSLDFLAEARNETIGGQPRPMRWYHSANFQY
jgi:hypothetical protein